MTRFNVIATGAPRSTALFPPRERAP